MRIFDPDENKKTSVLGTKMDFLNLDEKRIFTEIYGYSKEHANRVLSKGIPTSFYIEKGLEYFHKIKKILLNAKNCGMEESIEEFKKICDELDRIELPQDVVRYASEKEFLEGKYKLIKGVKEAVGIAPKAPLDNGKVSLHRIAVSFRLFICYQILQDILLKRLSELKEEPK